MPKAKKKKPSPQVDFNWNDDEKYKSSIDGKMRTMKAAVTMIISPQNLADAITLSRFHLLTEEEYEISFGAMGPVNFDVSEEDSPVAMLVTLKPKGKKAMKNFRRFMKKEKEAGRCE